MKRVSLFAICSLYILCGFSVAFSQTTVTVPSGCTSQAPITFSCGGTTTPPIVPPVVPPNPPPVTDVCLETQQADYSAFTRACYGEVTYSYGFAPTESFISFDSAFGTWDSTAAPKGQAAIFKLGKLKFVSFKVVPTSNTLKLSANVSWGAGGTVTISKTPGVFQLGSTSMVTGCFQNQGGTNNLIASANGWLAANCQLIAGQTYYVNFALIYNGAALCKTNSCPVAYTPANVN